MADAGDETTRRRGGVSAVVVVVAAVLAVEATALLWLAVDAALRFGTGVLPGGAKVMLVVIYALVGLGVGAASLGVLRGRAWARGAATTVQLFAAVLSSWLLSIGAGPLGLALLGFAAVGLIGLFTRPVTEHLSGR